MRKYQYYITGDDNDRDIYGVNWGAQTFTPAITHIIGKVKLKLFKVGDPGTVTVSIYATLSGEPAGGILCSGTIDGDTLTTDTGGVFYEITLNDGFELEKDTQYAISVSAPDGDASNKVSWLADITSPTFTGGTYCSSTDGGSSWSSVSGVDCMFEEWGVGPPSATTITWGQLAKSQISAEKIEVAIDRHIQEHEDDENAHIEEGESLYSHKASEIIDHIVDSIITDKIKDGIITNPKIKVEARTYRAIVDSAGEGDYTDIQDAIDYVNGLDIGGGAILILPGTYQPEEDIILYSNIDLIGVDPKTTIIDFQELQNWRMKGVGETTPYSTGTVTMTHYDKTVTGSGTSWLTNIAEGDYIEIDHAWIKIETVTDDTHLELEDKWKPATEAGLSYKIATMLENIQIENLTVANGAAGGSAEGDGNMFFSYIINSSFHDLICYTSHGAGFTLRDAYMCNVERIQTRNSNEPALILYKVSYSFIDNNNVSNNDIYGIMAMYCYYNTISNNYSYGGNDSNFYFYTCDHNSIVNNKSTRSEAQGFYMRFSNHNHFIGNSAIANVASGFYINSCDSNQFVGNTAKDNGAWGINIINSTSDKNIIVANHFLNNTSGGLNDLGTGTDTGHNLT